DNILVTRKAEVKVTDFGLSRLVAADQQPLNLTQSGVALGTPLYMAPEQVQGKPIDHRTDVYALGATCYHLLAGQPPFGGATALGFPPPPSRWPARVLGVLVLAGLAAGGWWAYGRTHSERPAAPAGPGLPDARPPEKVVSTRERELLKKVRERGSRPTEVAEA